MQLRRICLAILIAVIANSAPPFGYNIAVLSGSTRVLAQTTNTRKQEADRLLEQGNKQINISQFEAALRSYQQALQIYQSIKDQQGKAASLGNLGVAYFSLGEYRRAIDYHNQSLAIKKAIGDRGGEAASLNNLGNAYDSLGDYRRAIDYHNQSLALAKAIADRGGEANSLGNLGNAYYSLGEYRRAIDYQNQSLAIKKAIGDRGGEAKSLGNLGLAYDSLGDYRRAIDYHNQSLAIDKAIGDRGGEADSLNNLGNAYLSLGEYRRAIDYHNQSLAIKKAIGDRGGEAKSLGNLGNAYYSLGDYRRAIDYHNQSLTMAKAIGDRGGEANSLNNLGSAYHNLGDYRRAIDCHNQSLAIKKAIGDRGGKAASLNNLGNAYYSLGDYHRAIDYYNQSLALAKAIGDRGGEANSLNNLGSAYDSLGDYRRAIDYHNQSLAIKKAIGDRGGEAGSLNNLGSAYFLLGDYHRAIDYYNKSLTMAKAIGDRDGEAGSLNNLGSALLHSGNPKAAEENLRNSIAVKEAIRKDLGNNDAFKVSIFETQAKSYRLLQQALIAQNQTTEALLIAERGRARALIELLAQRQQLSFTPASLNIDQIKQIAKDQNATLVEYSIAWDDLYIWVVKPTGEITFQKVDIKKTDLGNVAEDTRTAAATLAEGRGIATNLITDLVDNTRATVTTDTDNTNKIRDLGCRGNTCLQQMHKLLILPIAKQLPTNPNSRVIFIPHESLFLVPFAALQDQDQKFLIEKHTISIAPSIQALELTRTRRLKLQQTTAQKPALVIGNPTMPKVAFQIGETPQPLDELPEAEKEAKIIAGLFQTQALTRQQATKAVVTGQMPQARIIHLATHGLLDELGEVGIPGQVALAPAGKDNGLLSANEVLNLSLNAQLVVLSACDTGRGRITGDGVIGLSRAFISAGTPSVIVSLWRVTDDSAAFLMPEFYRQLRKNPNKAQALRQAMLNTMKDYPNPSDWAAFLLVGEAE
jgi:CHAT domain-containing protein/lipopolysaccharide biosynthesis regulator YciM